MMDSRGHCKGPALIEFTFYLGGQIINKWIMLGGVISSRKKSKAEESLVR